MESIRSPLRRKLRVFKKRKFSKEQMKHPKRVSWSSDENAENEILSPAEDFEDEGDYHTLLNNNKDIALFLASLL